MRVPTNLWQTHQETTLKYLPVEFGDAHLKWSSQREARLICRVLRGRIATLNNPYVAIFRDRERFVLVEFALSVFFLQHRVEQFRWRFAL